MLSCVGALAIGAVLFYDIGGSEVEVADQARLVESAVPAREFGGHRDVGIG